jgi:hypothetical protein
MFVFSFWWKVPKGYMALELFFVSARTIKRHHHHHTTTAIPPYREKAQTKKSQPLHSASSVVRRWRAFDVAHSSAACAHKLAASSESSLSLKTFHPGRGARQRPKCVYVGSKSRARQRPKLRQGPLRR